MKIYRKYFTMVALIWAACFTVFVFAYMLFLSPQNSTIGQIDSKLAERKQRHDSIVQAGQEENRKRMRDEIERLRSKLKEFVIDSTDSAELTFDISQIASEKKVSAFSIKGKGTTSMAQIGDCKYISEGRTEISFVGWFNQFATFLNALERHKPVIFVDNFTISRARQDETGYQVTMNVAMFVRQQQ